MIGDLDSQKAHAEKLSIPQLQQLIRNGSLDPSIGIPILAEKNKLAQAANRQKILSSAGEMPKPPVAQRVMEESAGLPAIASNLPTDEYAQGGILAFSGEEDSYVDPEYLRKRMQYIKAHGLLGTPIEAAKQAYGWSSDLANATANPQTYSDLAGNIKSGYGALDTATKNILWGVPNQQAMASTPTPAPTPAAAPAALSPMQKNTAANVAGDLLGGSNVSPMSKYTPPAEPAAPPAQQNAAPSAIQIQNAAPQTPAEPTKSFEEYQKEWKGLAGENKGVADLKSYLEQQGKEYAEDKGRAPWMALMQAGLATMAGTSPFAMANIGAGGMQGLKSYTEDMKDLRNKQDKAQELQFKASQAQREEDMNALKYGADNVKTDKAAKESERLLDKKIDAEKSMAQAKIDLELKQLGAQIQHYADWKDVYGNTKEATAALANQKFELSKLNKLLAQAPPGSPVYNETMRRINSLGPSGSNYAGFVPLSD
jgi:hypothetical protein